MKKCMKIHKNRESRTRALSGFGLVNLSTGGPHDSSW